MEPGGAIGIFDSGVGGLTVLSALRERHPGLRAVYVADQAHVPYGERGLDEVAGFARGISRFLSGVPCAAIVMACNISSATALGDVCAEFPDLPVFGVIGAGVRGALASMAEAEGSGDAEPLRDRPIGVLATPGTARSGAYEQAIIAAMPAAEVCLVACPDLVPMIEGGEEETPRMLMRCMEYLEPLADADCGVVILGCTHYPLALSTLRVAAMRLYETSPVFVDPARALAGEIGERLGWENEPEAGSAAVSPATPEGEGIRLLTSGSVGVLRRQVRRLVPSLIAPVGGVVWREDGSLAEVEHRGPGDGSGPPRRRNDRSASSGRQRSLSGQPDVPSPRET